MVVITAPLSMTHLAGTPCTVTLRGLLRLSSMHTLLSDFSLSESEYKTSSGFTMDMTALRP